MAAEEIRFNQNVVVQQNDVMPARIRDSRVTRRRDSRLLFVKEPQWRGKTLSSDNLIGVVLAAVVNHYYFPRLGELLL